MTPEYPTSTPAKASIRSRTKLARLSFLEFGRWFMSEEEAANELLKDAGFGEEGEDPNDIFEGFDDFDDYQ